MVSVAPLAEWDTVREGRLAAMAGERERLRRSGSSFGGANDSPFAFTFQVKNFRHATTATRLAQLPQRRRCTSRAPLV